MTPKKLHRYYVKIIPSGSPVVLTDPELVHRIVSVMKFSLGESFIIFTDTGPDTVVTLHAKDKQSLTVTVEEIIQTPPLPREVIAAVSITKGSGFELVVQKLTEIGVTAIVPLVSGRTVKQAVRTDRLEKISIEALEQSGGNKKVTLHEPMTLSECFEKFPFFSILCDAHDSTSTMTIPDTVVLYVGPEGGWSESDHEVFNSHTLHHLKLGDKILRTETAAIIGAHTLLWHS